MVRPLISKGALAVALLALAGCVASPAPTVSPRPEQREAAPPSAQSLAFARYYRGVEARLVRDGLLRTDGGQTDAPFTPRTLAANFERIALFDEYALSGGRFVAQQTPSTLRRWRAPVRIQPHFGASVEPAQQAEDRSVLSTYAGRLARVTDHPIRMVTANGNFHVFYVDRDDQQSLGPRIREVLPAVSDATVREIEEMPRSVFCAVYSFSESGAAPVYVAAIAIIRDEHPDLLRRSCVHEEIAQGLGLPNDSPAARPSIFNDDDEFALLTPHDELLPRMLYDDRLQVGMTPEDARATVRQISEEFLGGPS